MALSTQLHLKQTQKLVMTPMLQQALKILQMNSLELGDLINQELSENPVLDELDGAEVVEEAVADDGIENAQLIETAAEAADAPNAEAPSEAVPEPGTEAPVEGEALDNLAKDNWEDYFDDNGTDYAGTAEKGGEEKEGFESFLSARPSLQEHLLGQINAEDMPALIFTLCEAVIGQINERGYFEGELAALAAEHGASEAQAFDALRRVQSLEPVGIGARNLRECLLLQLEARGHKDSLAARIVGLHLEDLERQKLDLIQKSLGISLAQLKEAEALISALEPFPGRPFGGEPNVAVTVDAFIEQDPQGRWMISVNDRFLPRLGFNQYYRKLMKQPGSDTEETKQWLKAKYESALWLIRGIESRHKTLRRVVEEIVEVQKDFFEIGAAGFQPLTLKDIALKTGLHESTVSRVTSSKYVQTPRGVFELKFFFSSGLKTDSGEDASSHAVKQSIRELLDEEDPLHPYSDQHLAEKLESAGIHIARRTVAKYREELGLLPAHRRRDAKKG